MMDYTLVDLSTELLLAIFKYLTIKDLCRLKRTCRRFNTVINTWDHILIPEACPLVTNQKNEIFLSRCRSKLSTLEKLRISKNWQVGRYLEKALLFAKTKYSPRLYVDDKLVWYSRGPKVHCFERTKNQGNRHINVDKPKAVIQGGSNADVGSFQVKQNLLVSGQRDASIWMVDTKAGKTMFNVENCHDSDIISVDFSDSADLIVSGSRDCSFKIWKVDCDAEEILKETQRQTIRDRVLKVSLHQGSSKLAVGTSASSTLNSLLIYDMEKMSQLSELKSVTYGMGVLDCKWDGPNILWSCGYDSHLKKWDLRTGKCEQNLRDPHATSLYCLDYDYVNTIMTGTAMHGRVILWDVRQNKGIQYIFTDHNNTNGINPAIKICDLTFDCEFLFTTTHESFNVTSFTLYKGNLFFMESCRNIRHSRSSPVYGLSFDSEYLFTATDQNLNVMHFYIHKGPVNDYSTVILRHGFGIENV